MRWLGPKSERPGWEKAPPIVETEIRTVWQEDELPDEITKAPGFRPFTLGLEAQEWVDSMSEVVDGGNGVYGRPKPVVPAQHRQLTTPAYPDYSPPVATPPTYPPVASPPVPPEKSRPSPPPKPRILMPDIDEEQSPTPTPRTQMPDIDEPSPPPPPRVLMPEVDDTSSAPQPRVLMPDVGDQPPSQPRVQMQNIDEASAHEQPHVLMPEVDSSAPPRPRTLPRRISMPEIGEEESARQKPPSMPEIG
ncbi:MAG TPA: hypothetical protein VF221_10985 [Chloroflexota bacterium]